MTGGDTQGIKTGPYRTSWNTTIYILASFEKKFTYIVAGSVAGRDPSLGYPNNVEFRVYWKYHRNPESSPSYEDCTNRPYVSLTYGNGSGTLRYTLPDSLPQNEIDAWAKYIASGTNPINGNMQGGKITWSVKHVERSDIAIMGTNGQGDACGRLVGQGSSAGPGILPCEVATDSYYGVKEIDSNNNITMSGLFNI
jgi:hypothetical protein